VLGLWKANTEDCSRLSELRRFPGDDSRLTEAWSN
jgi:hypothetical protein